MTNDEPTIDGLGVFDDTTCPLEIDDEKTSSAGGTTC